MLATLLSATLNGIAGRVVRVEVDVAPGLPGFTIVGLPDAALSEARERVRGALRNAGYHHPPRRITVNLAPAEVRKAGASLDLAIALGILLGSEQLRPGRGRIALIGELGLGGEVRHVPGILPMVMALGGRGIRRVVVPAEAAAEAALAPGIEPVPVASVAEAAEAVRSARSQARHAGCRCRARASPGSRRGAGRRRASPPTTRRPWTSRTSAGRPSLAGPSRSPSPAAHAMLLIGPPGSGKTLLARTIPGLLPDLDDAAALSATAVASAASTRPITRLVRRPPVRRPHHTISYAGMIGGGPRLSPGEVTLADQGTLVCDELPEFGRDVLEALRQPLEDGSVAVVRVGRAEVFPARFTFVAAMNPCPCGQLGTADRACTCPPGVPERYLRRVSGPLRDRIDLWVAVDRVPPATLIGPVAPESSAQVAERIAAARRRQRGRSGETPNGRVRGRSLRAICRLDEVAAARAIALAEREGLSGRGTERLLRVARTIADLAGSEVVATDHLDEAARFRAPVDRMTMRAAG